VFWQTTQEKKKQKKCHKNNSYDTLPHPKLLISAFDDGDLYHSPVVVISQYSHRILPDLAK
jgi:hypothetical protein